MSRDNPPHFFGVNRDDHRLGFVFLLKYLISSCRLIKLLQNQPLSELCLSQRDEEDVEWIFECRVLRTLWKFLVMTAYPRYFS